MPCIPVFELVLGRPINLDQDEAGWIFDLLDEVKTDDSRLEDAVFCIFQRGSFKLRDKIGIYVDINQDDVHEGPPAGEKSLISKYNYNEINQGPVTMTFDPQVLFEDQHLLCINKPAGLLSIRDGYDPNLPYVFGLLEPRFGKLWIVHRLDRETSGVLLLARTPESHKLLNAAFEGRQVHKTYHAIVHGRPPWEETQADLPLKVDADRSHRTLVHPSGGKPAQTSFRVLKSGHDFTLLEAHPLTGYTHQIRVHLLALGFPILSDPLYTQGSRAQNSSETQSLIPRLALHAYLLEFQHPITGVVLRLMAPYPQDFLHALQVLSLS